MYPATDLVTDLATLCNDAVRQYLGVCASPEDATLEGLLDMEDANWRAWKDYGYKWSTVRAGLQAAWSAREAL